MQSIVEALASDPDLWADFIAVCDFGGRQAGSESEARALEFVHARLRAIGPAVRVERVPYAGWRLHEASLTLDGRALACNPLLGSQSTSPEGLAAEICELGRGAESDFEANAGRVRGRCVLVRHEYPFSREHIHRRRKLAWAIERSAAAFIIANPISGGGAVAGSSGRAGAAGIPAVGTDHESAAQLARGGRIHLKVSGEDYEAETSVLTLDLPGRTPRWVALSAHLDGHGVGESAMDNATGVATLLALARALAPRVRDMRRGLRVCIFSAEEWALAGSRSYLDQKSEEERRAIVLNVNLDTVGGDGVLTALTSDFPVLDTWVRDVAAERGIALGTYQPMMANSDHYNFARHGIPALRLVAGFDRPQTNVRHILTRGDTRDQVRPSELASAACVAGALLDRALGATDSELDALR